MKPLILTLILATLSAPVCFGEWTEVKEDLEGNTYYVDFERIREHGESITTYYWVLTDYIEPLGYRIYRSDEEKLMIFNGTMSTIGYYKTRCDGSGTIYIRTPDYAHALKLIFYSEPMGKGHVIEGATGSLSYEAHLHLSSDENRLATQASVCAYVESKKNKE